MLRANELATLARKNQTVSDDHDNPLRVLGVSAGVAIVCAAMVTAAVSFFRPLQAAHTDVQRSRSLLEAAGLITSDADVSDPQIARLARQLRVRAATSLTRSTR